MKKERNTKRKLSIKRVGALVAVCFVAVVFVNLFPRLNYFNSQIKDLEVKIAEQKKLKEELSLQQNMYSSKEYVEKIAREELGLVRANEKVYIDSSTKESE